MTKKLKYCRLCRTFDKQKIEALVSDFWELPLCDRCATGLLIEQLERTHEAYEEELKKRDKEIERLKVKLKGYEN